VRAAVACVVLLAGCDRVFGLEREGVPLPDARTCFGKSGPNHTGLLELCPETIMPGEYELPQDIDSDDSPPPPCTQIVAQMDLDRTEVCVIAADDIRVTGAPKLHGRRPIVLLARYTITVDSIAVVDAASHRGGLNGAGEAQAICAQVTSGTASTSGGGGGAGAGFHGPGARGGAATLAVGGAMTPAIPLGGVRAGCRAGSGGSGNMGVLGGAGGDGGGALYLIAGERIELGGIINASGESGAGGAKAPAAGGGGGGGGGGGSGGLVGLDAPSVILGPTARLVANGGGGGGGGGGVAAAATAGGHGSDPVVFGGTYPFQGSGGTPGLPGGATGGNGAAATSGATRGGDGASGGGGGGGGGAAGYILIYTEHLEGGGPDTFSPPYGP
jgi:hypothetical protein